MVAALDDIGIRVESSLVPDERVRSDPQSGGTTPAFRIVILLAVTTRTGFTVRSLPRTIVNPEMRIQT